MTAEAIDTNATFAALTSAIVRAYVSNNVVQAAELPVLMKSVFETLYELSGKRSAASGMKPAIAVRKSVTSDYIVCLEDGKKLTMLKRHLRARYKLSPDEYRAKWGLPPDYPMVAPNYSNLRADVARKTGLGRQPKGPNRRRRP